MTEKLKDDDLISIESEEFDDENELDLETEEGNLSEQIESSVNIPLNGSPLYPRIFTGDSAKPLSGQFNDSEWVDDNIHETWRGLMSYYG